MNYRRNPGVSGRTVDFTPRKRHPRDKRPATPMPFDVGLRKFRKAVEKSGVLKDLRSKEFYEKPCQKRNRKKNEARRRWLKKVAKENAISNLPKGFRRR